MSLGPDRIEAWARQHDVLLRMHLELPRVHTVREAEEAVGAAPGTVGKTVVLIAEGAPALVIVPGDRRVDDRTVAVHLGVKRGALRMARPDEVLEWTGYPVGGVPPFAHLRPLRTLLDRALLAHDIVFLGGGTDRALVEVAPDDVRRVTDAEVGDFTRATTA